jgi:uridine phosphorylase
MLGLRSTIKSTNEYSLNTQTTTGKTLTVASTGTPALHVVLESKNVGWADICSLGALLPLNATTSNEQYV